jgi:hypothetical protein
VAEGVRDFGPLHFETGCGFKIQGAGIVEAISTVAVDRLTDSLVRVHNMNVPAVNVLLLTDRGTGFVLPAIREFLAAVTFDGGELVNVSYEPSGGCPGLC